MPIEPFYSSVSSNTSSSSQYIGGVCIVSASCRLSDDSGRWGAERVIFSWLHATWVLGAWFLRCLARFPQCLELIITASLIRAQSSQVIYLLYCLILLSTSSCPISQDSTDHRCVFCMKWNRSRCWFYGLGVWQLYQTLTMIGYIHVSLLSFRLNVSFPLYSLGKSSNLRNSISMWYISS